MIFYVRYFFVAPVYAHGLCSNSGNSKTRSHLMNVVKKVELDRVPDPARRPVPEEKLVPALEKRQ